MIFRKYNITPTCRFEVFSEENLYVGRIKVENGKATFISINGIELSADDLKQIFYVLRITK